MGSAEQSPWDLLPGQGLFEPAMHFMTDMFAIPQPVLDKGNFVTGQKVELTPAPASNCFDLRTVRAHVPPMPKNGGKGVRVAD